MITCLWCILDCLWSSGQTICCRPPSGSCLRSPLRFLNLSFFSVFVQALLALKGPSGEEMSCEVFFPLSIFSSHPSSDCLMSCFSPFSTILKHRALSLAGQPGPFILCGMKSRWRKSLSTTGWREGKAREPRVCVCVRQSRRVFFDSHPTS